MPLPNETRPEDRLRTIEEETRNLNRDIDRAAEAVHRAKAANSLASPGEDYSNEPEPDPADFKRARHGRGTEPRHEPEDVRSAGPSSDQEVVQEPEGVGPALPGSEEEPKRGVGEA